MNHPKTRLPLLHIYLNKFCVLLLIFISFTASSQGQDVILLQTGERIESSHTVVNDSNLTYIDLKDSTNTEQRISRSLVNSIQYSDAHSHYFNKAQHVADSLTTDSIRVENSAAPVVTLEEQGKVDAYAYYLDKNIKEDMRITTLIITPFLGWLPSFVCASIRPTEKNLNYPDLRLLDSPNYTYAYKKEAYRIKRHDAWAGYGKGTGQWFGAIFNALFWIVTTPFGEGNSAGTSSGDQSSKKSESNGNEQRPNTNSSQPAPAPAPAPAPVHPPKKK